MNIWKENIWTDWNQQELVKRIIENVLEDYRDQYYNTQCERREMKLQDKIHALEEILDKLPPLPKPEGTRSVDTRSCTKFISDMLEKEAVRVSDLGGLKGLDPIEVHRLSSRLMKMYEIILTRVGSFCGCKDQK